MKTSTSEKGFSFSLRYLNRLLSLIVVGLAIYILIAPVWPEIKWSIDHRNHKGNVALVQSESESPLTPIPKENLLSIPRLGLKERLHDGLSAAELNKGVWVVPQTSTPETGSNTVMAGHRFTYKDPQGVFYFLDKLQINDRVTVDWKGKEYTYKVVSIKEVAPTAFNIQDASPQPMITLFTCTPLWSPHNRLVVQASLIGERS